MNIADYNQIAGKRGELIEEYRARMLPLSAEVSGIVEELSAVAAVETQKSSIWQRLSDREALKQVSIGADVAEEAFSNGLEVPTHIGLRRSVGGLGLRGNGDIYSVYVLSTMKPNVEPRVDLTRERTGRKDVKPLILHYASGYSLLDTAYHSRYNRIQMPSGIDSSSWEQFNDQQVAISTRMVGVANLALLFYHDC
jgi:hypothetical protein